MHDFHRLRFVTERCQRLQGLSLVPLGLLFGLFGASLWIQNTFALAVLVPITTVGIAVAFLGAPGCLQFAKVGSFAVPLHPRQALLDDLICIWLIALGLGNHFLLRRTLKPVHFETI